MRNGVFPQHFTEEQLRHGAFIVIAEPRVHVDGADLCMRALRFAYPADFFRSGKREARRVLAKIDGKVVFAAELIPCDAAARHGGEHGIPQGGKAGLRICGGRSGG